MMRIQKKPAFIIIFVLSIAGLMAYLTQQLVNGVFVSSSLVALTVQREQARLLALSGLDIATKQLLSLEVESKKKKETSLRKEAQDDESDDVDGKVAKSKLSTHDKKFIAQILPLLNRWRTFSFNEQRDGFAGELKICLTCEEGKININEAFDFKKQEFKKEYAALLKSLEIKGKLGPGELATKLQEFLAKRARKLEDVSELAQIPVCKNLDIFYKPPVAPSKKGEVARPNSSIALSDIFTIWTDSADITPLLFSDGLCAMFTLRRPLATDPVIMKKQFNSFKKQFTLEVVQDWDAGWDILKLLFEQKPVFFKEMQGIFSKALGPKTYSVISYATVGKVTQRVMAIVKKVKRQKSAHELQGNAASQAARAGNQVGAEDGDEKNKKNEYDIKVLRLYWL